MFYESENLVEKIDAIISDVNYKLSSAEINRLMEIRNGLAKASLQKDFENWFTELIKFISLFKVFFDN